MTLTLVFTLPMPENLTNPRRRGHWAAVHGAKQKYLAACDLLQKFGQVPPPPRRPLGRVTIASVMRLGAAMDDDNAMARHKWALDWLKTRGYVADDRRNNIRWVSLPHQVVKRKQAYQLEITLTEEPICVAAS